MKAYPRNDLSKQGLSLPVGTAYLPATGKGYNYRWLSEDKFQIFYNGKWTDAYSIDFEFR